MRKSTQKMISRIQIALDTANGRSRERLLSKREIAQVLTEAMRDGYGYTTGGTVAKAYSKYGTAYSTMAFAVANGPDYIALRVVRNSANSSAVTWAGPSSVAEKSCRNWVARQTLYTLRDWIILSRAECKLFIRSIAEAKFAAVPDVSVTLEDSLAAGNCRTVTARVAGWCAPRTEVPARTLARAIQSREPLLIPFAQRAIAQAARRMEVANVA